MSMLARTPLLAPLLAVAPKALAQDTGVMDPGLPPIVHPFTGDPSGLGQMVSQYGPAVAGTAAIATGAVLGYKAINRWNKTYQEDPNHPIVRKILADGAVIGGKMLGGITALAGAAYLFGLNVLTTPLVASAFDQAKTSATEHATSLALTGLLIAAVWGLNRNIGKRNDVIQANGSLTDTQKNNFQTGFTISRLASVAGGMVLASQIWGADLGDILTAAGFLTTALALATKDIIGNFAGWVLINAMNKFHIENEVEVAGIRGTVKRITPTDIEIDGVGEHGDPVTHHLPPSLTISGTVTKLERNKTIIDSIHIGDWVTVDTTLGKVTRTSDGVLGVEEYPQEGGVKFHNFHLSDLSEVNFKNYGATIPLPDGVDIRVGDQVIDGLDRGTVKAISSTFVTVEIQTELTNAAGEKEPITATHMVTRTAMSSLKVIARPTSVKNNRKIGFHRTEDEAPPAENPDQPKVA